MDSVADRASIALQFFSRSSCFGQFQRDTTFSSASGKMHSVTLKYRLIRITEETGQISHFKNALLFNHAPTAKNKYEQIASRVPVSHLVWVKVTCTIRKIYIVTMFCGYFLFKLRKYCLELHRYENEKTKQNKVHINMLFKSNMPLWKIKGRRVSNALNHPQARTSLLKQSWPTASITRVGWKPCYATLSLSNPNQNRHLY